MKDGDIERAEVLARTISESDDQARVNVCFTCVGGGRVDAAVSLAEAITDKYARALVLSAVADAVAGRGDIEQATELADRAERLFHSVSEARDNSEAIAALAVAAALAGNVTYAESLADTITDDNSHVQSLTTIAKIVGDRGESGHAIELAVRAEALASSIVNERDRFEAYSAVGETLAKLGEIDRAETLAHSITDEYYQFQALAAVHQGAADYHAAGAAHLSAAADVAENGCVAYAKRRTPMSRRLCSLIEEERRALDAADGDRDLAAYELVASAIDRGDVERAEALVPTICDEGFRDITQLKIARFVAESGDIDRAQAIAQSISNEAIYRDALGDIARVIAEGNDFHRAEEFIATMQLPAKLLKPDDYRGYALRQIAEAAAEQGDIDRAEALADTIPDQRDHAEALSSIAKIAVDGNNVERAVALANRADALRNTVDTSTTPDCCPRSSRSSTDRVGKFNASKKLPARSSSTDDWTRGPLITIATQLAADGHRQSARVLARAWIGADWVAPLTVLGAIDMDAVVEIAAEIGHGNQ